MVTYQRIADALVYQVTSIIIRRLHIADMGQKKLYLLHLSYLREWGWLSLFRLHPLLCLLRDIEKWLVGATKNCSTSLIY